MGEKVGKEGDKKRVINTHVYGLMKSINNPNSV